MGTRGRAEREGGGSKETTDTQSLGQGLSWAPLPPAVLEQIQGSDLVGFPSAHPGAAGPGPFVSLYL